jgi:hypothetical protein
MAGLPEPREARSENKLQRPTMLEKNQSLIAVRTLDSLS